MKKKAFKSIPITLFGVFLVSCSGQNQKVPEPETPTPGTVLVPSATPSAAPVTMEPEPTMPETTPEVPTLTPEPTATPMPETTPVSIPEPNFSCMYVNYANSFPIIATDTHMVEFHYNDIVTVTNTQGYSYELSLSQSIVLDGLDLSDPDLWYFCGALQSGHTIYAHFDYLNNTKTTPSMLIKLDLYDMTLDAQCCILSCNPIKHFQDNFTITNDYIYYTNTSYSSGIATTDIIRTNKNGGESVVFYTGLPGETIHYMACDGNYLSYIIMGSDEKYRLVSINLSTGRETLLSENLLQPDFLIGWNGYVFTSVQNKCLTYFDCTIALKKSIAYTDNTSVSAGYPLTDGQNIYLPLIPYSGKASTTLLPVDLITESTLTEIHLDEIYYYSIGMIDQYLYVENEDSFLVFDLTGKLERTN